MYQEGLAAEHVKLAKELAKHVSVIASRATSVAATSASTASWGYPWSLRSECPICGEQLIVDRYEGGDHEPTVHVACHLLNKHSAEEMQGALVVALLSQDDSDCCGSW